MKRWIAVAIMSTAALWGPRDGEAESRTAAELTAAADGLQRQGELERAEALYRRALAQDPSYLPAYSGLSTHLLRRRQYQAAGDLLKQAVQRVPNFAQGWYNLAYALRKQGKLEAAVGAYRTFARLRPESADPHYGIALARRQQGRYAAAAASFRRYAEMERRKSRGEWVDKARALAREMEQRGRQKAAPAAGPASRPKSVSAEAGGEKTAAQSELAPLVASATRSLPGIPAPTPSALPEDRAGKLRVQGDTVARHGRCAPAMKLYLDALAADPFAVAAYDGIAYCTARSGDYATGVRLLGRGLRDNPGYDRGWLYLARLERQGGRWERAIGAYRRYLGLRPRHAVAHFELARVAHRHGRIEEARAGYRNYLKLKSSLDGDVRRATALDALSQLGGADARVSRRKPLPAAVVAKALAGGDVLKEAAGAEAATRPPTAREARRARLEARRQAREAQRRKAEEARRARLEARRQAREARRRKVEEAREARRRKVEEARQARLAARQARIAARQAAKEARRGVEAGAMESNAATVVDTASAVGSALPVVAGAPEAESAARLVTLGDEQFAKRQHLAALGIYRQAQRIDPKNTEALHKAAVAALAAGQMGEASRLLERIRRREPDNQLAATGARMTRHHLRRRARRATVRGVRALLRAGRQQQARRQLDRLIAEAATAEALVLRARVLLAEGKAKDALVDVARALALEPARSDALRLMGDIHRKLGQRKQAVKYYRRYLSGDARGRGRREVQSWLGEQARSANR